MCAGHCSSPGRSAVSIEPSDAERDRGPCQGGQIGPLLAPFEVPQPEPARRLDGQHAIVGPERDAERLACIPGLAGNHAASARGRDFQELELAAAVVLDKEVAIVGAEPDRLDVGTES